MREVRDKIENIRNSIVQDLRYLTDFESSFVVFRDFDSAITYFNFKRICKDD
jgi:hypothetical protein